MYIYYSQWMLLFMSSGGALLLFSIPSINAINENLDVVTHKSCFYVEPVK